MDNEVTRLARQGRGVTTSRAEDGLRVCVARYERDNQAVARPLSQGDAEVVLKLADLAADRPVGDAQLVGGQGHPPAPAERLEGAQGVERRHRIMHEKISIVS